MSYAIIQTGGKQYKVKAGEIVKIENFFLLILYTNIDFIYFCYEKIIFNININMLFNKK